MSIVDRHCEMIEVLHRQTRNLQRIDTGVDVHWKYGHNQRTFTLIGPKIDLIKLFDQPIRLMKEDRLINDDGQPWERIVTLSPTGQTFPGAIGARTDGRLTYRMLVACRITEAERKADHVEGVIGSRLGDKIDALLHDVLRVFYADLHLHRIPGDPHGPENDTLLSGQTISCTVNPEVDYPWCAVECDVVAQFSSDIR